MSVIQVWNGDGRWSEAIFDYIRSISSKLLFYQLMLPKTGGCPLVMKTAFPVLNLMRKLSLLMNLMALSIHKKSGICFGPFSRGEIKMNFSDIYSFIIPLVVLESLRKEDKSLSRKYEQIITAAKVPVAPPVGYCLCIRFEAE